MKQTWKQGGKRRSERPNDCSVSDPGPLLGVPNKVNQSVPLLFPKLGEQNICHRKFQYNPFLNFHKNWPSSEQEQYNFFLRVMLNRLPLLTGKALSNKVHPQLFTLQALCYGLFLIVVLLLVVESSSVAFWI